MIRKIIGATVGTPISPSKIEAELKPVKTVNGVGPDKNGNVKITISGSGGNAENSGAQSDWNAAEGEPGHVLNRTHWVETAVIDPTFDGDLTGRETVQVDESTYFVKVSPQYVSMEDAIGSVMVLWAEGTEMEETVTSDMVADTIGIFGVPGTMVGEFCFSFPSDATLLEITFTAGTWFACVVGEMYMKSLSCLQAGETEIVHKLDPKFLPTGSGGGIFTVTVTDDGSGNYTLDKSFEEMNIAYQLGMVLQCIDPYGNILHPSIATEEGAFIFSGFGLVDGTPQNCMVQILGELIIYNYAEILHSEDIPKELPNPEMVRFRNALCSTTRNAVNTATYGDFSYDGNSVLYMFGMANPYSLKFTGAVTATYDGKKEVTVNIPEAGNALPEVTSDNNGAFLRVVNGNWMAVSMENAEGVGF